MVKLFILIINKGSNKPIAAVKVKSGRSRASVNSMIKKNTKKGFISRVITESQLMAIIKRSRPRTRAKPKRRKLTANPRKRKKKRR